MMFGGVLILILQISISNSLFAIDYSSMFIGYLLLLTLLFQSNISQWVIKNSLVYKTLLINLINVVWVSVYLTL